MTDITKNKIFDLILADALKEYFDEKLAEYDEINKPHNFSGTFEKKMRRIINSIGRSDRIKKFGSVVIKVGISFATAFGIIFGFLLTQPDVFASVQNVFRSVFDKYDKYEYVSDELTTENFDDSFRLGYVPEGYYLSFGNYSPAYIRLTYTDEYNELFFIYSIANDTSDSYDNEHNSFETFVIDGIEYYYYKSNDKDFPDTLLWYEDGYYFSIIAHLSKEELIKIAENIEK